MQTIGLPGTRKSTGTVQRPSDALIALMLRIEWYKETLKSVKSREKEWKRSAEEAWSENSNYDERDTYRKLVESRHEVESRDAEIRDLKDVIEMLKTRLESKVLEARVDGKWDGEIVQEIYLCDAKYRAEEGFCVVIQDMKRRNSVTFWAKKGEVVLLACPEEFVEQPGLAAERAKRAKSG